MNHELTIALPPVARPPVTLTPSSSLYPPAYLFIGSRGFADRYRHFLEQKHKALWENMATTQEVLRRPPDDKLTSLSAPGTALEAELCEVCLLFDQVNRTDRLVVYCRNKAEIRHHNAIRDTLTAFLKDKRDVLEELVYLFV